MSDSRAKELIDLGDRLFTNRQPLLQFWQDAAENFYPERADFTQEHVFGEDFAEHLMDSFPALLRRELGNSISANLRPRERQWFRMTTLDDDRDAYPRNRIYLESLVNRLKSGIYNPKSKFIRATKEGDHDFVTFGQCVLTCMPSADRAYPFFRGYHLRDCAWLENAEGEIDHVHRKDKLTARKMASIFGEAVLHEKVKRALKDDPGQTFKIRCIVMPAEEYEAICKHRNEKAKRNSKNPFVVIYIDVDNCKMLREDPLHDNPYIIPRWHTVSGWQYAFSPCTTISLPDARMAQSMAQIILEAGEKSVDPPLIANSESIREVNAAAGALTWADIEGDGKLSEAIRPIDFQNDMRVAFEMRQDMREMLTRSWFIEKLTLPRPEGSEQMTATEATLRNEEFIRNLLPLFEPMEIEYNTRLLDKAFGVMRNMGRFPSDEVPEDLAGEDVSWQFESPIQTSQQRMLVSQFGEALQLIGGAVEVSQVTGEAITIPVNLNRALQDAIRGTLAPADWSYTEDELEAKAQQEAEAAEQQSAMAEIQKAAGVTQDVAGAAQQVQQAMMPPQLQGPGGRPALPPPNSEAA